MIGREENYSWGDKREGWERKEVKAKEKDRSRRKTNDVRARKDVL